MTCPRKVGRDCFPPGRFRPGTHLAPRWQSPYRRTKESRPWSGCNRSSRVGTFRYGAAHSSNNCRVTGCKASSTSATAWVAPGRPSSARRICFASLSTASRCSPAWGLRASARYSSAAPRTERAKASRSVLGGNFASCASLSIAPELKALSTASGEISRARWFRVVIVRPPRERPHERSARRPGAVPGLR